MCKWRCACVFKVNTLQQIQNIASYPFLHDKLQHGEVRLHALYFDIYDGDFHMFSRERKRFVEVDDDTYNHLVTDGESYAMKICSKI